MRNTTRYGDLPLRYERRTATLNDRATVEYQTTILVPSHLTNKEAEEWIVDNDLVIDIYEGENTDVSIDGDFFDIKVRPTTPADLRKIPPSSVLPV